jgi:hypothetical protein
MSPNDDNPEEVKKAKKKTKEALPYLAGKSLNTKVTKYTKE